MISFPAEIVKGLLLTRLRRKKGIFMANILWLIVAVLVAIWLVGLVFDIVGGIIHILIVIAVAVAIYAFIKRKV
jgi:hypothetical protein